MSLDALLPSRKHSSHGDGHWIPLSDLMTGLMMVFMLVAIVFMIHVQEDAKKSKQQALRAEADARSAERQAIVVKSIALIYEQMRLKLYDDLYKEFAADLPAWGAEILHDLTIRFREPDVLFDSAGIFQDKLKPRFIAILDNFFPRYVRILSSPKYKNAIEEIRIEGHTSSFWMNVAADRAYFENMALSQSRTRTVLEYVLGLPQIAPQQLWLKSHLTANGLSSSKLIYRGGKEDTKASQRVEFRVKTNADDQIDQILRQGALK